MTLMSAVGAPDTQIIREARELARTTYEPYLFNHVMRSWLFAAALAEKSHERPDAELLAVAAILHDLGLTARYATKDNRFEVDGANATRDFLRSHRLVPADLQTVWDAVALHSTRSIALYKGAVVSLCHQGVQVDVSGTRLDEIDDEVKRHILHEYPRLSFKAKLTECLCGIVRNKPQTTYDNFMKDFGERYVAGYQPVSSVDRLNDAPFAE